MDICEILRTFFVVFDETWKRGAGDGALDDPSSQQPNEAAPGLGQVEDLERDTVLGRRRNGFLAGVTFIDKGDDAVAGRGLDRLCHASDLGAIAGVTWSASMWPSVATARFTFEPFLRLAPRRRRPRRRFRARRAAVDDLRARLLAPPDGKPQHRA